MAGFIGYKTSIRGCIFCTACNCTIFTGINARLQNTKFIEHIWCTINYSLANLLAGFWKHVIQTVGMRDPSKLFLSGCQVKIIPNAINCLPAGLERTV